MDTSVAPCVREYGYDAADQLLTATPSGSGSGSAIDAFGYWYDAAGNRTVEQIANAVTNSAYNTVNQITSRSGGGLLTITGTLDRPGTVTVSGTTYLATGSNNAFAAVAPVVTGSNNIVISATNVNGYGVTKTLSVNVTGGTAIPSLTYDSDGNLTNDSTLTYGWDAVNRLTAVNYPTGAGSTFAYDGQGRRVQIIETGSSGGVTSTKNLVWEGMNISEEKNASGTVTKRYFPQGVQIGGMSYYYTRDHLGSIRELTDASGTVQARFDYDPYGRQTQLSGTMIADFGYTGLYVHQPSGMLFAVYRPYLPSLGRWGSRDPIAEAGGINLYDYVGNQPINAYDPLGLATIKINGNSYTVMTGAALQQLLLDQDEGSIQTFEYDGHSDPDTGELYLGEGGLLDGDLLSSNFLQQLLEQNQDVFDPNARIDLKACGSANGPRSAANIFKGVLPGASVWGATGYYGPFGPADQNPFVSWLEGGYDTSIPYHSQYIEVGKQ